VLHEPFTSAALVTTTLYTVEVVNALGCGSTTSITISVPKLASAGTISATAADLILCPGDTLSADIDGDGTTGGASATLDGSVGAIEYQWQISYDNGGSYQDIVGATNADLASVDLGTISQTVNIHRLAYAMNAGVQCAELASNAIQITLDDTRNLAITSSTGGFSFCENTAVTFTAVGAVNGDTYEWEILSGATTSTSTGTVAGATTTDTTIVAGGSVKLTITTAAGCSYDITEPITVVAVPAATVSASATTVCANDTVSLTASPAGQATYTFRLGGVIQQTGASRTFTSAALVTTTLYTVEVVNALGCGSTTSITISVPKLASAGTISATAADLVLCPGDTLSADIDGDGTSGGASATLDGSVGAIEYQWQISYDNGGSYQDIVGATNADLASADLGTISQTVNIHRLAYAMNAGVQCAELASNAIQITLDDSRNLAITSSTGGFSFCENDSVTFTAVGAVNGDTYEWEILSRATTSTSTGTVAERQLQIRLL